MRRFFEPLRYDVPVLTADGVKQLMEAVRGTTVSLSFGVYSAERIAAVYLKCGSERSQHVAWTPHADMLSAFGTDDAGPS
jgi:hypothetical protein